MIFSVIDFIKCNPKVRIIHICIKRRWVVHRFGGCEEKGLIIGVCTWYLITLLLTLSGELHVRRRQWNFSLQMSTTSFVNVFDGRPDTNWGRKEYLLIKLPTRTAPYLCGKDCYFFPAVRGSNACASRFFICV